MIYYITKQNDTLQRIAAKMYGDWTLWYLIFDANRSLFGSATLTSRMNWMSVQSGLMVFIPVPLTQSVNHTIVDGDSYHSLSLYYYGSEHYAKNIKAKNDSLILGDNIGKKITIPALLQSSIYSSAQSLIETGVSSSGVNAQLQVVVSDGNYQDKYAIFYNEFVDGLIGGY